MHRLQIRVVGKPQENWQTEAIESYLTRLSPFAKIEILEIKEGHGGATKPDENKTRAAEAGSLLKNIPTDAIVVALDETGTNLTSPTFARHLETWGISGQTIVFLIGGSWGLDASVKARAKFVLSLGKHTLPHLLARIVLLEQLYRAETILAGKVYHK